MTPRFSDFEIVSAQAVVFTPGGQLAVSRVLSTLLGKWPDVFGGDPVVFPKQTPIDMTRILLNSSDAQISMDINAERAALLWNKQTSKDYFNRELFVTLSYQILLSYLTVAPAFAG